MLNKPDIVNYIGNIIYLKRPGRYFIGRYFFHNGINPSFVVCPEIQTYKCYECQESGNVISFVMQYEGISFKDALSCLDTAIDTHNNKKIKENLIKELKNPSLRFIVEAFLDNITQCLPFYEN